MNSERPINLSDECQESISHSALPDPLISEKISSMTLRPQQHRADREEPETHSQQSILKKYIKHVSVNCGIFNGPTEIQSRLAPLRGTIIAVEGGICAGKTTLMHNISSYLKSHDVASAELYERPNQGLLRLFYEDSAKYAFTFQSYMLEERKRSHEKCKELAGLTNNMGYSKPGTRMVWSDRSLWGDVVFALLAASKGFMSDNEYGIYLDSIKEAGPYWYDYILFLDVTPDRAFFLNRKMRNNPNEEGISLSYLRELRLAYYIMMRERAIHGRSRVVLLDNRGFVPASYAIDCVAMSPSADQVAQMWSHSPDLDADSSPEEVELAYAIMHMQYKAVLPVMAA